MGKESDIVNADKAKEYGTLEKSVGTKCDIDDLLGEGGWSRFQLFIQFSTYYLFLITTYNFVFSFFTGGDPGWKCVSGNSSSSFCKVHYNETILPDNELFSVRCDLRRSEWTYVTEKQYSFVTEYDLICDRTTTAALISSSFYMGGVLGATITGSLADTYGRVLVLLFCTLITFVSSIGSGFVTNIWQLFGLNIFRGAGNVGCYYTAIVYQTEMVPPKYRSLTTSLMLFGGTSSFVLIDLLANFVRNWRHLTVYAAIPTIPMFIVFFLIPESPRWLLVTGKLERAQQIMEKLTTISKIRLSSPSFYNTKEKKYTYLDLFRNLQTFKLTATIMIIWFVFPVVYYSIALQSSSFGGDMYEAFALSSMADIPACVFSSLLLNKLGRKKTNLGGLLLSGILMGSMILVPRHYEYRFTINLTIAVIARCANMIAFIGMYCWTWEIFPTVLRAQGLSLCAIFDRLGMFTVPFITRVLQNISYVMPFLIMAAFAIFASVVGLLLPETLNKPTRESYEDFVGKNPDNDYNGDANNDEEIEKFVPRGYKQIL